MDTLQVTITLQLDLKTINNEFFLFLYVGTLTLLYNTDCIIILLYHLLPTFCDG